MSSATNTIHPKGGAVISGTLTASRDININHITTIRPLARALHHSFFTSSDLFKQVQNELALLLVALDTTKENLEGTNSSDTPLSELDRELQNCHWTLLDLQAFKEHFENVGPDTQVTWEREGWRTEDLGEIRARLSSYTGILNFLSINMIKSSQAHVEQLLRVFIDEIHSGRREGSVVSNDSLSMNGREAWRQLRKELESVGISHEALTQNRYFILSTLKKAISQEGLGEDINIDIQDMDDLDETKDGFQKAAPRPRRTGNGRPNSILPAWITNPTRIANTLYQRTGTKSSNASKNTPPIHPSQSVRSISSASSNAFMENNALIHCAANGDLDLVKQRLADGQDVNVKNDAGETPLSQAAKYGHMGVVRVLLEHKVDINQINPDDDKDATALHNAAENGHDDVVRLLLAHGADLNVTDFWQDKPLHKAAEKNHMKTVQILLNKGAKTYYKAYDKASREMPNVLFRNGR